jgi:hypothetical protein
MFNDNIKEEISSITKRIINKTHLTHEANYSTSYG